MQVTNAILLASDNKLRMSSGCFIDYISKENVIKDSIIEILYEDVEHYFSVSDISIDGDYLNISAREIGYYATKFYHKGNIDLRNLIGLNITKVEDSEKIIKIKKMSCWC